MITSSATKIITFCGLALMVQVTVYLEDILSVQTSIILRVHDLFININISISLIFYIIFIVVHDEFWI